MKKKSIFDKSGLIIARCICHTYYDGHDEEYRYVTNLSEPHCYIGVRGKMECSGRADVEGKTNKICKKCIFWIDYKEE